METGQEYMMETVGNNCSVKIQPPGTDVLCSPLCCLHCREGLKFHGRLQPTMGSHSIASILFSCNWVCFWSIVLEGMYCYSLFFSWSETFWTLCIYLFILYLHEGFTSSLFLRKDSVRNQQDRLHPTLIESPQNLEGLPHSSLCFGDNSSSWECTWKKWELFWIAWTKYKKEKICWLS